MADRKDFFYRQKVDEADLDAAFSSLEASQWSIIRDLGYYGVFSGLEVGAHIPVSDLSVDLEPGVAYDPSGRRVYVPDRVNVNVATDYAGASTDVVTAGASRLVGIYAKFDRTLNDRRIDGNSQLVYFSRNESYKLLVSMTDVHASVSAGDWEYWREFLPVPPEEDCVLLAVVWRRSGQTQILGSDIGDIGRPVLNLDGTRRAASSIDVQPSPGWADASSYPLQDLQVRLNAIQRDLGDSTGAAKVGAPGIDGSVDDLIVGSVGSQLAQLLGFVNTRTKKSGDTMTGGLVPSVTGLDLGSSAARWDAFIETGTVFGSLLADTNGVDLGSATARWDAYLQNAVVYGSLLPAASGVDLGSAAARWEGYFTTVNASGDVTPSAAGLKLGSSSSRWEAFLANINVAGGSFSGTLTFSSAPALDAGAVLGGHVTAKAANVYDLGDAAKPLRNVYAKTVTTDGVTFATAKTKTKFLNLFSGQGYKNGTAVSSGWELQRGAGNEVSWKANPTVPGDFVYMRFPVDLPDGCTITKIEVIGKPGGAFASGSRMGVNLFYFANRDAMDASAVAESSVNTLWSEDNGSNILQTITMSGLNLTVGANAREISVDVHSAMGTGGASQVYAIRITYTQPGL